MRTSIRLGIVAAAALAVWTGAQAGGEKGKTHGGDKDHVALESFVETDRAVAEYLTGEVLSPLPEERQEFLRRISVPDQVSVPPVNQPSAKPESPSATIPIALSPRSTAASAVKADRVRLTRHFASPRSAGPAL